MKKKLVILLCLFLSGIGYINAQSVVSGVVLDEYGEGIIGASVRVKGTSVGAATDIDGTFSLTLPAENQTIIVSFIGYITQELVAAPTMRIAMVPDTKILDEVVVTAMGISRERKSLGYAVQTLKSDDLLSTPSTSLSGALQGKVSGVEIRPSSGMPGASTLITIRGARSFTGNNAPLYVIDGMPIESTPDVSTGNSVTGTDFANRAVDIDPNDIESLEVLRGQAASALYGIRASNGVIVITTKSGRGLSKGKPKISFTSNVTFDQVSRYPNLQKEYAQGSIARDGKTLNFSPNTSISWGPKIENLPNDPVYGGNVANKLNGMDANKYKGKYYVPQRANGGLDPWIEPQSYDNMRNFLNTGVVISNSLNVAQMFDRSSYGFSIGHSNQEGIVPNTGMDKYNVRLTAETRLTNEWKTGFNGNVIHSNIRKMPGANDGIMAAVFGAPPSYDLQGIPYAHHEDKYKDNNFRGGGFANPYWLAHNNSFNEVTNRFFGNSFLEYAPKLNVEGHRLVARYQLGTDFYTTQYQDLWSYGNRGGRAKGQVEEYSWNRRALNSLFTLNHNWDITPDLDLNTVIGNEIVDTKRKHVYAYGKDFVIKGWNHIDNALIKDVGERSYHERTVGFFGNLSFSYKRMLFLSATGRMDYVSTMPRDNRKFFYPSVSFGFIFTEIEGLKNNNLLNFGKLRLSYAQVGQAGTFYPNFYVKPSYGGGFFSGVPIQYPISEQNAYIKSSTIYDNQLRPQNTLSYEAGLDLNFFQNMITINYTFSRQEVKDQIFSVPLAGSTGYSSFMTNGGFIHTNAHEVSLNVNPIRTKDVDFSIGANFSKIDNYVDKLAEGVESIFLGGFVTPQVRAGIGDKFPVIYGTSFVRDEQGNRLVGANGHPLKGPAKVIGEVSPDFILGVNTSLRFRMITLSALFDWKSGGQMYAGSAGVMNYYGVTQETADARNNGVIFDGYKEDGTKNDIKIEGMGNVFSYFDAVGDIDESNVKENSYVKLRELALNVNLINRSSLNLSLSLYAKNILLWTNYPHLDPESSQGNTNMGGAFERFSLPQTTSYGASINVQF